MSRPVGSKNKPKSSNKLLSVELKRQFDNAPIISDGMGQPWISIGKRNDYYEQLLNLYNQSVTMKACVLFTQRAICGDGLDVEKMKLQDTDLRNPNYYTDWNTFIQNFVLDYIIYGAAAFEVIMNKDRKTYSFFNIPYDTVRPSAMDNDGIIPSYWICSDWSQWSSHPPVEVKAFGFQPEEKIQYGKPYIFVLRNYNPLSPYFASPRYQSAINQIQAEVEMQTFDFKNIVNQFIPQGMLQLPPVETEQEKEGIVREIQKNFQGASNAGSLMIQFSNGIDDVDNIKYTPFVANKSNVDLYEAANERVVNRICQAFGIANKSLIGLPADNSGFSDSGNLLAVAFNLFNVNVASPERNIIASAINNAFKLNGVETEIIFKPLNYILDSDKKEEQEDTPRAAGEQTQVDDKPVDDDEATEQVVSK